MKGEQKQLQRSGYGRETLPRRHHKPSQSPHKPPEATTEGITSHHKQSTNHPQRGSRGGGWRRLAAAVLEEEGVEDKKNSSSSSSRKISRSRGRRCGGAPCPGVPHARRDGWQMRQGFTRRASAIFSGDPTFGGDDRRNAIHDLESLFRWLQ